MSNSKILAALTPQAEEWIVGRVIITIVITMVAMIFCAVVTGLLRLVPAIGNYLVIIPLVILVAVYSVAVWYNSRAVTQAETVITGTKGLVWIEAGGFIALLFILAEEGAGVLNDAHDLIGLVLGVFLLICYVTYVFIALLAKVRIPWAIVARICVCVGICLADFWETIVFLLSREFSQ